MILTVFHSFLIHSFSTLNLVFNSPFHSSSFQLRTRSLIVHLLSIPSGSFDHSLLFTHYTQVARFQFTYLSFFSLLYSLLPPTKSFMNYGVLSSFRLCSLFLSALLTLSLFISHLFSMLTNFAFRSFTVFYFSWCFPVYIFFFRALGTIFSLSDFSSSCPHFSPIFFLLFDLFHYSPQVSYTQLSTLSHIFLLFHCQSLLSALSLFVYFHQNYLTLYSVLCRRVGF